MNENMWKNRTELQKKGLQEQQVFMATRLEVIKKLSTENYYHTIQNYYYRYKTENQKPYHP